MAVLHKLYIVFVSVTCKGLFLHCLTWYEMIEPIWTSPSGVLIVSVAGDILLWSGVPCKRAKTPMSFPVTFGSLKYKYIFMCQLIRQANRHSNL